MDKKNIARRKIIKIFDVCKKATKLFDAYIFGIKDVDEKLIDLKSQM
jgi:hypothetical protein